MYAHELPGYHASQKTDKEFLERWAAAYTLVKSIPDDQRFDMANWAHQKPGSECGTAACLAGHALFHSWFIERGFALTVKGVTRDLEDDVTGVQLFGMSDAANTFWGTSRLMTTPFDPDFGVEMLDLDPSDYWTKKSLRPDQVAEAVYAWMVHFWGFEAADAAIAASTVVYSAEEVHKNTPWSPTYVGTVF